MRFFAYVNSGAIFVLNSGLLIREANEDTIPQFPISPCLKLVYSILLKVYECCRPENLIVCFFVHLQDLESLNFF